VGIDLTQATTRKAIGITGATTVYLTEVELTLGGSRGNMNIPVGFIDSPYELVASFANGPNLL
jgi:hypothetical protein